MKAVIRPMYIYCPTRVGVMMLETRAHGTSSIPGTVKRQVKAVRTALLRQLHRLLRSSIMTTNLKMSSVASVRCHPHSCTPFHPANVALIDSVSRISHGLTFRTGTCFTFLYVIIVGCFSLSLSLGDSSRSGSSD
jgi:hypothetical protein